MLTTAYFLLKVIICSGILYGYYYLALRNKIFHHWNRFYLLMVVILSLIVPLVKINIQQNPNSKVPAIHLLQLVSTGDEFVYNYHGNSFLELTMSNILSGIYILISGIMLMLIAKSLFKIHKLKKKYPAKLIEGINFRNTTAPGTPFSFFNNIFWNKEIDINTSTGKNIFQHELAHVQEKHSHDKIFINLALAFFWYNPFFWLIRKELNMIHEFIADKKSLDDMDTAAFAEMIIKTTYPQQSFILTNNFFYSPLKRRLSMLTKNKHPKISYFGRLAVLPIIAIIFFAFTLKMKKTDSVSTYTGKMLTVVIDAGHGGGDRGAIGDNEFSEKDMTLKIATKIKELNTSKNLNIVLSREGDVLLDPRQRVNFAKSIHADLFISIHLDAQAIKNEHSGLSVYVPQEGNLFLNESKKLGSSIIESFKNNYSLPVANNLVQRNKGVWILKENTYPAILIEAGYITTKKDADYLTGTKSQEIIAKNILKGIENYAQARTSEIHTNIITQDSIPVVLPTSKSPVKSVIVIKNQSAVPATPKLQLTKSDNIPAISKTQPLIIVDGVESAYDNINSINPNTIKSVSVLKNESAIKKYGDKGKDGVIEIVTKVTDVKGVATYHEEGTTVSADRIEIKLKEADIKTGNPPPYDKIFTRVENPAQFPGGEAAWSRYIKSIIEKNIIALVKNNQPGTCVVRFIVDAEGYVSDVSALTLKDTKLAEVAINAIKNGPKWNPATQNNRVVVSYREMPVTFKINSN